VTAKKNLEIVLVLVKNKMLIFYVKKTKIIFNYLREVIECKLNPV
jgi:hypothetical protein